MSCEKPKASLTTLLYFHFPAHYLDFQRVENGQTEKKELSFRCRLFQGAGAKTQQFRTLSSFERPACAVCDLGWWQELPHGVPGRTAWECTRSTASAQSECAENDSLSTCYLYLWLGKSFSTVCPFGIRYQTTVKTKALFCLCGVCVTIPMLLETSKCPELIPELYIWLSFRWSSRCPK